MAKSSVRCRSAPGLFLCMYFDRSQTCLQKKSCPGRLNQAIRDRRIYISTAMAYTISQKYGS